MGGKGGRQSALVARHAHRELGRTFVHPALLVWAVGELGHVLEFVGNGRIEGRLTGSERAHVDIDHVVLVGARVDRTRIGVRAREVGGDAGHVARKKTMWPSWSTPGNGSEPK